MGLQGHPKGFQKCEQGILSHLKVYTYLYKTLPSFVISLSLSQIKGFIFKLEMLHFLAWVLFLYPHLKDSFDTTHILYRAIYLIPVYICFMEGVTYIHTKTSLMTKYCNITDQVVISGKTKKHLMQPLWTMGLPHLTSPYSHPFPISAPAQMSWSPTEQLNSHWREGERGQRPTP